MSRATVDLQAVRFFLGYGLIFMAQAALTIVIAAAVMIYVNPFLALVALAPTPFVIWTAMRYGRLNRPASQEVQQRIAELTATAEENVSGVRVVKGVRPGAPPAAALPPLGAARLRPVDGARRACAPSTTRAIGFLPQLGLAAIVLVGGRQAIDGTISVGDFVAFYGYVLMLTGPMRMLGMALGMAQRAVASGNRIFEILDREPRLTSPPDAPPLPAGGGHVELRGVTFALRGRRRAGAARHRPRRRRPGARSRSSARPEPARRRSST